MANVIVNVAFYGYWGVLLAFEIKAKHRVAAAGTAFTMVFFAFLWWL